MKFNRKYSDNLMENGWIRLDSVLWNTLDFNKVSTLYLQKATGYYNVKSESPDALVEKEVNYIKAFTKPPRGRSFPLKIGMFPYSKISKAYIKHLGIGDGQLMVIRDYQGSFLEIWNNSDIGKFARHFMDSEDLRNFNNFMNNLGN